MTLAELKLTEQYLYSKYLTDLAAARKKYAEENSKFEIGDFIYNVTGIIKIEKVGYDTVTGVVYYGKRYKKNKNVLSRTKDKKIDSIWYNPKKIDLTDITIE